MTPDQIAALKASMERERERVTIDVPADEVEAHEKHAADALAYLAVRSFNDPISYDPNVPFAIDFADFESVKFDSYTLTELYPAEVREPGLGVHIPTVGCAHEFMCRFGHHSTHCPLSAATRVVLKAGDVLVPPARPRWCGPRLNLTLVCAAILAIAVVLALLGWRLT